MVCEYAMEPGHDSYGYTVEALASAYCSSGNDSSTATASPEGQAASTATPAIPCDPSSHAGCVDAASSDGTSPPPAAPVPEEDAGHGTADLLGGAAPATAGEAAPSSDAPRPGGLEGASSERQGQGDPVASGGRKMLL